MWWGPEALKGAENRNRIRAPLKKFPGREANDEVPWLRHENGIQHPNPSLVVVAIQWGLEIHRGSDDEMASSTVSL